MKTFNIQIRSERKPGKLLYILLFLGFSLNVLFAQDTLTDIIPASSTMTKLSSNQFGFLEGPVWFNDSVLLFVDDAYGGTVSDIYKYDPDTKQITKWPSNSTHCTGLSCDKDGNLIGASFNILLIDKAGQLIKTLASEYNGKSFDNPNDLIADDMGGVYFSDPDFFLTTPPQDKTAIYYIDSTGNVKRVIDDLAKPNGLVLSPDGTKLYAVDTKEKYIYSWDVTSDGSVSGKQSLAELEIGLDSYADGMAVDINGNIYVATDKGIQVFSPEGVAITIIEVPEQPSNCDFGGPDFKTLYITAHTNIYSIDLKYEGYAVYRKFMSVGSIATPGKAFVELYPNPAGDVLYINLEPGKISSIEVMNMAGKKESILLKKEEGSEIEINTQALKPGMYLLKIYFSQGLVTRKFVKK
jgi:gluconolactonase